MLSGSARASGTWRPLGTCWEVKCVLLGDRGKVTSLLLAAKFLSPPMAHDSVQSGYYDDGTHMRCPLI